MYHPKRILLVDDDYDHLLICSLLLRREKYDVRTMAGCEKMDELTMLILEFRPDLIFMDHEMRGICGMDLIKMLKSFAEFKAIPVIYFTGRDDIVELASEAGANGYFRKPFKSEGLIEVARTYLSEG